MIGAALVAAAARWMFGRLATGLVTEWVSSPDASYGLVLALVAAALLWRRRHAFAAAIDPHAPRGVPLLALGVSLLMFVAGQLAADLFLTRLACVLVCAAAAAFLAGTRAVRTIAAPIAFLAMAVPLPAILVNAVTLPLQLLASRLAESLLLLSAVPVFRDGNLLTLPSTTLEVAEACSGLRSLVSLVAIGVLGAWMLNGAAWRRLALVAAAVPIAIVMNGLRIAATGLACESFGPRAASGTWHEAMGWITFVLSVAVFGAVYRALDRTSAGVRDASGTVRVQADQTPVRLKPDTTCTELA